METDNPELLRELKCKISLEEALDLHVDLVVRRPGQDHPIHHIAKSEGVLLNTKKIRSASPSSSGC